jgi:hypothetical protein
MLKRASRTAASHPAYAAVRLLGAILADDAEIRDLSEPWLKQLEALLGGRAAGRRR